VHFAQRQGESLGAEAEAVIRSRNVLMRLSRDLETVDERPVIHDEPPLRETAIQGLEDCRLFDVQGTLFFLCATADRHPSGHIHLSICRLEPDGRVVSHRPLIGPFDDRPQKNWLPFVDSDGTVRAIYGYAPLTVVRLDVESGGYAVEAEVKHSRRAKAWRGSAGPVSIPGGDRLLMLVHEVSVSEGPEGHPERIYLHRFIECDASFALTRVSRPFVFAHDGIEFACGMALAHDGRTLVIGFGIEDSSAYLCEVSLDRVESMLRGPRPRE
jgi:hypothetical protein